VAAKGPAPHNAADVPPCLKPSPRFAFGINVPTGEPCRQDTGCKLSAAKTNTPLNAMFCGVFRVNLLTSPTPQMSYLRS
jgi:hypothetical protein